MTGRARRARQQNLHIRDSFGDGVIQLLRNRRRSVSHNPIVALGDESRKHLRDLREFSIAVETVNRSTQSGASVKVFFNKQADFCLCR